MKFCCAASVVRGKEFAKHSREPGDGLERLEVKRTRSQDRKLDFTHVEFEMNITINT